MKRYLLPVVVAAVVSLGPAAGAQVVSGGDSSIDVPSSGTGRTERTERIPGTGRTPGTPRTEGTGRTPGTGRIPGTGRTPGTPRTGDASRLPRTGASTAELAMDGLTVLGAGLVLLHARRRVLAS